MGLMDYEIVYLFFAGLLGLCIGSFLNVAIHRIPIMLDQAFKSEIALANGKPVKHTQTYNLVFPGSHCPHCQTPIPYWANIPIISYLFLFGKSTCCHKKISLRYPITEILCTLLTIYTAYQFGFTLKSLFAMTLVWALITLSFIDIEHMILPDNITIPMIWVGLLANTQNMFTSPNSAILGAIAGYSIFWVVAFIFKKLRGLDGLGSGDYKLLSLLGAWLGWELLPFILLFSSFCGIIFGLTYNIIYRRKHTEPIPFGPFLAIGGIVTLFWGYKFVQIYIHQMVA